MGTWRDEWRAQVAEGRHDEALWRPDPTDVQDAENRYERRDLLGPRLDDEGVA